MQQDLLQVQLQLHAQKLHRRLVSGTKRYCRAAVLIQLANVHGCSAGGDSDAGASAGGSDGGGGDDTGGGSGGSSSSGGSDSDGDDSSSEDGSSSSGDTEPSLPIPGVQSLVDYM